MNRNIRDIDFKIVAALDKLSQVQRILLWDVAKNENLSPIQIQFIQFIQQFPPEMCRVSVLAREFDLTKATVSDAITTLETKGLIEKTKEEGDRRTMIISLTSPGKRIAGRLSGWQDTLYRRVAGFNNEEKEKIAGMLMELIKGLFEEGVIRVARMCIACTNFKLNAFVGSDHPHKCGLTGSALSDQDYSFGCVHYSAPE
jgi:DNA-binding MarR family transcriptional regulator